MTTPIPLLLALGLNELITTLVGLSFLVFWVISQIADAKRKQAQQPQRPAMPPPGPRDGAEAAAEPALQGEEKWQKVLGDVLGGPAPREPAAPHGAPIAADPLRAQVNEFLRRAGHQGQPQPAQPAPPPRPPVRRDEIEVLVDDEPAEPARRPLAEPLRPMGESAARPRPSEPPRKRVPRPPRRAAPLQQQSVADHVAAHVDAAVEQIRQEVSHLGEAVITADKQFDVQLQQKFDHELGTLRSRHLARVPDQQATPQADTPATRIAAMLANPEGVRQAIIVNEILRRPDEQW